MKTSRAVHLRSHHGSILLALALAVSAGACGGASSSSRRAAEPDSAGAYDELDEGGGSDDAGWSAGAAAGQESAFAYSVPTTVHPSIISFAVKMGAKRVSKATLKNFVKTRIKDRLARLTDRKIAREFAEEADQIMGMLEDPWWSTAIGFIPLAGDAFDLARVPAQIRKAMGRAGALEARVRAALDAEHKARQTARAASSAARYVSPPRSFKAFPGLVKAKDKTPIQGAGGLLRKRWKDKDGNIYEWDYQHGRLEKYNRQGRHLGEFDPDHGKMTKGPDSTRRVEP